MSIGMTALIPVLMIGFGFTQERANGTSLAMMLPPIGILAVFGVRPRGILPAIRYTGT